MCSLHRIGVLLVATLVVTLVFLTPTAYASSEGTIVGGRIKKDTVWTKENGPYILEDDLTVPSGVSLTIEEGVTIDLKLWSITVEGVLRATGTPEEKVCFNITLTTLKENRNGRIYFTPESRGYKDNGQGCLLEYVVIHCSDYAISYGIIRGHQLKLDHVEIYGGLSHWKEAAVKMNGTVTNSLFDGTYRTLQMDTGIVINNRFLNTRYGLAIDITDGVVRDNVIDAGLRGIGVKNALVKDNVVMNMEIVGISIHSGTTPYTLGELRPIITNNVIMRCGKAVTISGQIRPLITDNVFLENTYGVYFDVEAFYGGGKPRIEYNAFYDNSYNVYMYREDPRIAVQLDNNWWGTNDLGTIEEKIYDVNDNPRLCQVLYTPVLSEPPLSLPPVPYKLTVYSTSTVRLREQVEISGEIVPPLEVISLRLLCVGPDGERYEETLSTDSWGYFSYEFTPGSIGIWSIAVTPEEDVLLETSVTNIQVNVAKIDSSIELDVTSGPLLEGDMVTIDGVLTPGMPDEIVEIGVLQPDGSEYNRYTSTGSGGTFKYEIGGAQPGLYKVTFTWPGTDDYMGSTVTVSCRIQVPCGMDIVVEDDDGNKLAGTNVKLSAQSGNQITLTGSTDSEGHLSFTRITAGDYVLTVEKAGYELKTFASRVSEGETRSIVTVLSEPGTTPATYPSSTGEASNPKDDPLILGFIPSIITVLILVAIYVIVRQHATK